MPDETPASPTSGDRALWLADWTLLGPARFGDCYRTAAPFHQATWETIVAVGGDTPIVAACLKAGEQGYLDGLAEAVAKWERDAGRPPADIAAMLEKICTHGVMQGMTDQQKGFMSADILLPVALAGEACAIVAQNDPGYRQLGTAFLVRPDMVLTAGHVALDADANGWAVRLKPGLTFRFRARPNQPRSNMVTVRAASGERALVASSLPNGDTTGDLNPSLDPPADARLDFALVRLAQRVEHITPVTIVDTARVESGKPCWAFGYTAGSALIFDVDRVTDINATAGRWLHTANTDGGMSGGCCINHLGQVAGIHEGTVEYFKDGVPTKRNRGISIAAIRRIQCSTGKDPLKHGGATAGVEFNDPILVGELYHAGLRLGGVALAQAWHDQFVTALDGLDPKSGAAMPPFYPWFKREDFETYIASPRPADRLCLVYGEAGSGKSFCGRILAERLDPAGNDLLALSSTQVNAMNWADAISQVLIADPSQHRTAAATVRYRDIDEVITVLKQRIANTNRAQHVVLDFGPPGDASRFIATPWIDLVMALAAADSIRVTVIGLEDYERMTLIEQMANGAATRDVAIADVELAPISRENLRRYAESLAEARGVALSASDLRMRIDVGLPREMSQTVVGRSFQTVAAALSAIAIERTLQ